MWVVWPSTPAVQSPLAPHLPSRVASPSQPHTTMSNERLQNYIGGQWLDVDAPTCHTVLNPATEEVLGECPLGSAADVDAAVRSAAEAFPAWRRTSPVDRVQPLYKLKALLQSHADEMAAIVTRENGKTRAEAMGSVLRGIQMVEVAIGSPSLLMGSILEDVSTGIDCASIRQPMGVFACIAPFNFPAMVPLWFFPFAVACGNTFVCKPSEQVPFSQKLMWELIDQSGFPPGILNLVQGGRDVVNALTTHPQVEGVSFVGSSPVARHVYKTAAEHGKRVQALGGAKNFITIMPDADMDAALDAVMASAFGCAGERCLAASIVVPVGDCHERVREGLKQRLAKVVVGDGSRKGVTLGPLISASAKERVLGMLEQGVAEGADLVVDGRKARMPARGFFLGATLFDNVTGEMTIGREEIFGPVLSIMPADTIETALRYTQEQPLANASSIFTTSGAHGRFWRYHVEASMVGVNIGVAAPMAFFGFGGSKGSFFGDLKAHGREAYDFFTDRKVVISRW